MALQVIKGLQPDFPPPRHPHIDDIMILSTPQACTEQTQTMETLYEDLSYADLLRSQ